MAVCLECKADYLSGITVCPACGRALEPDPPGKPPASDGFVPFYSAGYPEGLAAAASLEAAGLETMLNMSDVHAYMATPLFVTVLVRERDLDAACAALRLSPEGAIRVDLGMTPKFESTDSKIHLDEDVKEAVEAINRKPGVRTVCSCSGSHPGAGQGFIAMGPSGTDAESVRLFDTFLTALFMRLKEPELRGRLSLQWTPMHGAELKLLDPTHAQVTWSDLARLVASA